MNEEEERWRRKSGKLIPPEFGKWEEANQLPITQYFECARQAGLLRFSNTASNSYSSDGAQCGGGGGDLNYNNRPPPNPNPKTRAPSSNQWPPQPVKGQKKQVKKKVILYDVTKPPIKKKIVLQKQHHLPPKQSNPTATATDTTTANKNTVHHSCRQPPLPTTGSTTIRVVKPVDEDLYKIPPDLLHTSKQKKRLGFFSRCLVADCMV